VVQLRDKNKYIVLCYEGSNYKRVWREIKPPGGSLTDFWEGDDIGKIFNSSVIENKNENLNSTSYLVLPYDDGALFNISININTKKNSDSPEPFETEIRSLG
jgi:hypothetical protein